MRTARRLLFVGDMPTPQAFARNTADKERLTIVALDPLNDKNRVGAVRAHYNPKEVQIDKTVTWNEHKATGQNEPDYQYTAGNPRTMSMELFFDCAEIKGGHLEPELEALQLMTLAINPKGSETERRPPLLEINPGPIPNFRCVLESLTIKVTMFNRQMQPVRATAQIKLKELRRDGSKLKPNGARDGSRFVENPGTNWQAPTAEELDKAKKQGQKDRWIAENRHQGLPDPE